MISKSRHPWGDGFFRLAATLLSGLDVYFYGPFLPDKLK
jgi:hypothetical protein